MKAIALAMLILLTGCATASLPDCPRPRIGLVESDDGAMYVLDGENMARMAGLLEGLSAGTCKPAPAKAGPQV